MKKLFVLISLCFTFSIVQAEDTFITLLSGNKKGTYYKIGTVISKVVSDSSTLHVTLRKSPGSLNNINSISKKEAEIAFVQNDLAHWAKSGTSIFAKNPKKNIRAIAMLYPEHIQIITRANSPLYGLSDLIGKKIGVGSLGSGGEADARAFFNALNIRYSDINPAFTDFNQTTRHIRSGSLHAGVIVAGYPTPVIEDLVKTAPIRLIPFSTNEIEAIRTQHPFFEASEIPAGIYGLTTPIKTISVRAMLITHEDVPDEVVYIFTKTLFENLDKIQDSHELTKTITLKKAPYGSPIPLHNGAARYYREVGLAI